MTSSLQAPGQIPNPAIPGFRKSARVLSGIIAVFLVLVGIAELWEGTQSAGPPPAITAILGMSLLGTYGLGLALSLRWERTGALAALASITGIYIMMYLGGRPGGWGVPRGVMLNPFMLFFWVPILLYVLCWVLERWGQLAVSAG